ncbi:MAG: DUF423 domain-containing protein [Chthonomonadales bacterium]
MSQRWMAAGSLGGMIGVMLGAFGAHALKGHLPPASLELWDTAVRYQMTHSVVLLFVGLMAARHPQSATLAWSARMMISGILLFSGSLYLLAAFGARWLGAVTPLGGICFILGWLLLLGASGSAAFHEP